MDSGEAVEPFSAAGDREVDKHNVVVAEHSKGSVVEEEGVSKVMTTEVVGTSVVAEGSVIGMTNRREIGMHRSKLSLIGLFSRKLTLPALRNLVWIRRMEKTLILTVSYTTTTGLSISNLELKLPKGD